jgi:hypothetical protein
MPHLFHPTIFLFYTTVMSRTVAFHLAQQAASHNGEKNDVLCDGGRYGSPLVDAGGFSHRSLEVQALDVLPVLLK